MWNLVFVLLGLKELFSLVRIVGSGLDGLGQFIVGRLLLGLDGVVEDVLYHSRQVPIGLLVPLLLQIPPPSLNEDHGR